MSITIQGTTVRSGNRQMSVPDFCQVVSQETVSGMSQKPIPDGVRWICEKGDKAVYIVELPPELRLVNWSEDGEYYGRYRTLAMPYVVVKVPFNGNQIYSAEVFYRNEPLRSINYELYHTNLRNISGDDDSWWPGSMCMDGFSNVANGSRTANLSKFINHLWMGEFNNEMGQNFEMFCKNGDKRLSSIERWEEESKKDPDFVLGVKWFPAGVTVKDLIDRRFGGRFYDPNVNRVFEKYDKCPDSSKALGNLLLTV